MKKQIALMLFFAACFARAEQSLQVGTMLNQIQIVNGQLYAVDSGTRAAQPSVQVIDPVRFGLKSKTAFPMGDNLYRATVEGFNMWITSWSRGELLKLNVVTDLARAEVKNKAVFYRLSAGDNGMESVARHRNQTWVTVSNFRGGQNYGPGKILVLEDGGTTGKLKQTFITDGANPKQMTLTPDGLVLVATGKYGREDGQLTVIEADRAPLSGGEIVLSATKQGGYYKVLNLGGTPGEITWDQSSRKAYVCDLEEGSRRYFVVDPQTGRFEAVTGRFNSCGAIGVRYGKVYLTNFLGGEQGEEKAHLFVYDQVSGRELCSMVLKPGGLKESLLIFPNDLEVYHRSLFVSYGGYPYVSKISLDANGRPEGCL